MEHVLELLESLLQRQFLPFPLRLEFGLNGRIHHGLVSGWVVLFLKVDIPFKSVLALKYKTHLFSDYNSDLLFLFYSQNLVFPFSTNTIALEYKILRSLIITHSSILFLQVLYNEPCFLIFIETRPCPS